MGASRERKEAEESVAKIEKKEKKDKKDKKEKKDKKRSETDGVHKNKEKGDKKEKKQKKEKLAQALDAHLQASAAESAAAEEKADDVSAASSDNEMADAPADAKKAKGEAKPIVRGAIVEFAIPMATDKYQKKVFKIVKRAAKQQALLRGVKEVNKALRKAPPKNPSAASTANVPGIVVIAGDVNPAEVIMHLPLACEDVNAPYVFVASRGELGQAARTKRPTSVVMIKAEGRATKKASGDKAAKADSDDEDEGSYAELYQEFVKLTQKEYTKQMKGII
ncbi:h aca ribonucleoprotein complex subunit 2 [Ophiostoma piceae UAMH 11346]|uniref:H aca ribonucleoprotein complex subunit 2 n=1 Tax=Ophiostoma piceae (strain UAMH 11346) TaxID=1262450 RepID=S3CXU5_OPHP1|nr:h aca ribonucleoprotein complex subunit 2 [Ophiostoma piceae UAMH 11346]